LGISSCKLTNFVPLRVCGLDLTPSIVWIGVDINGASVTILIDWGIATNYKGTDLTSSIFKFEVHA
jgi:hypothetical protein